MQNMHESIQDQYDALKESVRFLRRMNWDNLRMLPNSARRVFDGASLQDWWYARRFPVQVFTTFGHSLYTDTYMNAFQQHSAEDGYVSTPENRIGVGITDRGRMSYLAYPHPGRGQHIPYFVNGDDNLLDGARPREGGFAGIRQDDDVTWFWDDAFDIDMTYRTGTGILDVTYAADDVQVEESIYALLEEPVVARDITLTNRSDEPLDGDIVYYLQANANTNPQTFIAWNTDPNVAEVHDCGVVWQGSGDHYLHLTSDPVPDNATVGANGLDGLDQQSVAGRYLSGTLSHSTRIDPGDDTTLSVFTAAGDETGFQDDRNPAERQADVEDWWQEWTDDIVVEELNEEHAERYVQAAITLGMIHDSASGAFPAAPNTQPMYYPSWIRDGAFMSVALASAGKPAYAKDYLARFCPDVQEPDGSFKQCYDGAGDFRGIIASEHDQEGLYIWAVRNVYRETQDDAFLNACWPSVRDAADYLESNIVDNGLLAATPDIAEMPTDIRQSLWTNTWAYRAFHDMADLAEAQGDDPEPYRETAQDLGNATHDVFFPTDATDDAARDAYHTFIGMTGPGRDVSSAYAAAYPTEWAQDYDEYRFQQVLDNEIRPGDGAWMPGTLLYTASLYIQGKDDTADRLLTYLEQHQNAAGDIAEQVDGNGSQKYASPLGWAQASYLLALDEKHNQD